MRQVLGYVAEADLDLMLVLDAHVGGPLTSYLLSRVGAPPGTATGARSTIRCGGTRETDVELTWKGGSLLVEDKIDAPFTPGQPASYRQEVGERRARGEAAWAVLVCPERLSQAYKSMAEDNFDAIVTCEQLAEVAERGGGRFGQAAAAVFRAAAEPRATATPQFDPGVSAWGDGYRDALVAVLPPGEQLDPGPGSLRAVGAEWMSFRCAGIDPPEVWNLSHWVAGGVIRMEILIPGSPADLPTGATAIRKPMMWWIEHRVPSLDMTRPAAHQIDALETAISAALALSGVARF